MEKFLIDRYDIKTLAAAFARLGEEKGYELVNQFVDNRLLALGYCPDSIEVEFEEDEENHPGIVDVYAYVRIQECN